MCCAVRVGAELYKQLSVTAPFDKHDHKGSAIILYLEKTGATNIMQSFVRVSGRERWENVVLCLRVARRGQGGRLHSIFTAIL